MAEVMVQNVAYRATVYRTGGKVIKNSNTIQIGNVAQVIISVQYSVIQILEILFLNSTFSGEKL